MPQATISSHSYTENEYDDDATFAGDVATAELEAIFEDPADRAARHARSVALAALEAAYGKAGLNDLNEIASEAIWAEFSPPPDWAKPEPRPPWADADDGLTHDERRAGYIVAFGELPPGWRASTHSDFLAWEAERVSNVIPLRQPEPMGKDEQEALASKGLLPVVTGAALLARDLPAPTFLVPGWFQSRKVNLLSGEDGSGKSFLMLQLAVAIATGTPWLGIPTERGPVVFYTAEEEDRDLNQRLRAVCRQAGVSAAQLGDLHLIPMGGAETSVLGGVVAGAFKHTPLWQSLCRHIAEIRPRLVILDPLNEISDVDELKRVQARQFVGMLRPIAALGDLAFIVTSHPSKAAVAEKTCTSGSTGWSAVMRARCYLEKVLAEDNVTETKTRVLHPKKLTGAERAEPITLFQGAGGVLLPEVKFQLTDGAVAVSPKDKESAEEQSFLARARAYIDSGRSLSPNKLAGNYAPKALAKLGKGMGEEVNAHKRAMERLFCKGALRAEIAGRKADNRREIVIC